MLKHTQFIPLAALGAILSSTYVSADDYQSEISVVYFNSDSEHTDSSGYGIGGRYFFNPVNTSQGPLAEAAFLQRASSVGLNYTRSESDHDFSHPDGFTSQGTGEDDSYSLRTDFYLPNSIFYAGLTLSHGEYSYRERVQQNAELPSETFKQQGSETNVSAVLGITPIDGLRISTAFYEDYDLSEDWNLSARWVTESMGPTIAFTGGYAHAGGLDVVNLGADYYIDRSFSIGLTHSDALELDDSASTSIRARKFFTENFSVQAEYVDDRYGSYNLGATMRF